MGQREPFAAGRATGQGLGNVLFGRIAAAAAGSGQSGLTADQLQQLFDALPDVVFFVKDVAGRYTHVNLTLAHRLGRKRRADVIGRHSGELYSAALASAHADQDRRILKGERIDNCLEQQIYPNRPPRWCLTRKEPLYVDGRICGIVGVSRDLGKREGDSRSLSRLRTVLDHFKAHFSEPVRLSEVTRQAGLSTGQLARLVRRIFHMTPQQLLAKYRIDAAMQLLSCAGSIAAVGQACGFSDQSALARQFKATVGMSPRAYRNLLLSDSTAGACKPFLADANRADQASADVQRTINRQSLLCAEKHKAAHSRG